MALFNVSVWQRSRFTLQWFIINLVGSLAWLSTVALAQFEWRGAVSGSGSIPGWAFMCLGSLAVFVMAFTRRRLDMENGARDVLATTRGPKLNAIEVQRKASTSGRLDMENGARDVLATNRGPKLNAINGCGLTTRPPNDLRDVDVVMLSKYKERPHSSLTEFMQYISHSHALESILLQLKSCEGHLVSGCRCVEFRATKEIMIKIAHRLPRTVTADEGHLVSGCRCVVFQATEEIMIKIAHRLPRTLKRLSPESNDHFLLPSLSCLNNDCHGCNHDLLYVPDLIDVEAAVAFSERRVPAAAVCEALDQFLIEEEENSCICIPLHPANDDRWTRFLIKFLKSKEKEAKGIKVRVSDALQRYITRSAEELSSSFGPGTIEIYNSAYSILPRVAEVIVNIVLTVWLRVDGFSSSLLAHLASRDYVVDSKGTGFSANAFLTRALVFGSADWTNVCQVLEFRRGILSARSVSYIAGCVNVICSITWSLLIGFEGNWAHSPPLSTTRLAVIIVAVGVALGMDCFEFYVAETRLQAQARVWAWAQDRDPDPDPNRGRGQDRVRVRDRGRDQDRARDWAFARAQVEAQFQSGIWVRDWVWDQAWTWAWALAPDQVLALMAVVILEVECIVSLVVMLSMKKALGRWVYGGMQVLVWVKWGIGSFLLGDNAGEKENRGTWVYFSAFLLWVGMLPQWEYFKLVN